MKLIKKCLLLFWDFFKIGLFTFGGGYAMIALISQTAVERRKYLSAEEFSDLIVIAESTPGPIAINSATYVGFRAGGVLGSIFATLGVVLPSFIIILLISIFLPTVLEIELIQKAFKGVQCAVVVLIISAAVKLFLNVKKDVLSFLLMIASAALLFAVNLLDWNVSTIYFIVCGGLIGFTVNYSKLKLKEKKLKTALGGEVIIEDGAPQEKTEKVKEGENADIS